MNLKKNHEVFLDYIKINCSMNLMSDLFAYIFSSRANGSFFRRFNMQYREKDLPAVVNTW